MLRVTIFFAVTCGVSATQAARIECRVVDEEGRAIPARVSIHSDRGTWHFAKSASEEGTAVDYKKERQAGSVEMHTTLSAHPFTVDVPPGGYTITAERGKEYQRVVRKVSVPKRAVKVKLELKLRRWINMAERRWYSGDTHVHRSLEELPNVMLAEDLNVAFPLTYWVTQAGVPPARGNKTKNTKPPKGETVAVDATHLIYPMNTEYEIFTVNGKRHTQGAVFILGHKTPFPQGAPPVAPLLDQIRKEGAVLDVDKHNWPWSLMIIPVMKVETCATLQGH